MRLARWVQRLDRAGRIDPRPNQEPGLIEHLGLTPDDVARAAWAVEPDGKKFEGAAGINRTMRELGRGWALLAALYRLPPIRWIENAYYGRVARRRAWW
jgi:predicted DCC family thiol-disulfide oxidoreductase YuxK